MTNYKNNIKKLIFFFAILITIYLLFSVGSVVHTLYSGLVVSPNLKPQIWKKQKQEAGKYVIGIISPIRGGELNQAFMVKQSAEKLGHKVYLYAFNDLDMNLFIPAQYVNNFLLKIFDFVYKTDFHLAMSFHMNIDVGDPKIMYISVPEDYVLSKEKFKKYPEVMNYNNFLDINLLNSNKEMMSELLGRKVNSSYGLVGFPATEYKTSNRQKLLMFGSLWGRKSDNFYQAIVRLAAQDYMYFIKSTALLLASKQRQQFAQSAPNLAALIERMNQYGIVLCTHSHFHIRAGIPSSRIFEIISAGAIAISDKNPFVIKYFGDNVLYYDQNASAEEIFTQVDNHVKWVQTHPKEAEEKAKNAHKILQEQFTTEKFVQDMIKLYKEITKNL